MARLLRLASLHGCRDKCFRGNPTALAASPAARANGAIGLKALITNYHDPPMDRAAHHKQVNFPMTLLVPITSCMCITKDLKLQLLLHILLCGL